METTVGKEGEDNRSNKWKSFHFYCHVTHVTKPVWMRGKKLMGGGVLGAGDTQKPKNSLLNFRASFLYTIGKFSSQVEAK